MFWKRKHQAPPQKISYQHLKAISDDLNQFYKSPGMVYLFKDRMDAFYKNNKTHFDNLNTTMEGLIKKYVLHDAQGQPRKHFKNRVEVYTFKTDKAEKEYTKAVNEFMANIIEVK